MGIAGLAGAGQTELLRLFLGLEKPVNGEASLNGKPLPRSPAAAWAQGVACVPGERRAEGLMMGMGVRPNMLIAHLKGLVARAGKERSRTLELTDHVGLKSEGPEQPVWQLSGGNQQKVVFARALAGEPTLLLLDEPTRGVDIGARFEIYALVRKLSEKGTSVLISSSDLPELLGMCDRILVLQDGRQTDILETGGKGSAETLRARYADLHEKISA